MVEISIDGVAKRRVLSFARAMGLYQKRLGNSQAVAVRRGTISLVKSLRNRTKQSKKMVPAYNVIRSEYPPYLTPKGKNQKRAKAWKVLRHGTNGARWYVHPAKTKGEARKKYGTYSRWGLAKQSWGWFMHSLFNRSDEVKNPKAKVDSRMVEASPLREIVTGGNPRVELTIVNKLDYIRAALQPGALEQSMHHATKFMYGQLITHNAKARAELGL